VTDAEVDAKITASGSVGKGKIAGKEAEQMIAKGVHSVDFEFELSKGETTLDAFLYTEKMKWAVLISPKSNFCKERIIQDNG
jgi:deoxyadenosine/deoxycytidine kinase